MTPIRMIKTAHHAPTDYADIHALWHAGVWAVHRGPGESYTVTHVPTGRSAWQGYGEEVAVRVLAALESECPQWQADAGFKGLTGFVPDQEPVLRAMRKAGVSP